METLIRCEGVQIAGFVGAPAEGLEWTIRSGERWALWGANGSGKSSLLALLAGRTSPAGGRVLPVPGLRVHLVPQEPEVDPDLTLDEAVRHGLAELRAREEDVREEERRLSVGSGDLERLAARQEAFERAGGWEAEPRLRRELADLLPGRDGAVRVGGLSTGELRRLSLGLALAARPELLLLDEPTNGLDVAVRRWLAARLRRLDVAVVVASHDRALLSAVSTHSARLTRGHLEPVALPFDRDRERRGVRARTAARRVREARAQAARARLAADRARAWGTSAARSAARAAGRRAEASAAAAEALPGERTPRWSLAEGEAPKGPVLWARGLSADGVLSEAEVVLEGGAKIALLGPNGSGKSTLLALLAGERASTRPEAEVWTPPGLALHHWDARSRGLSDEPVLAGLTRRVSDRRAQDLLALVRLPQGRWTARPGELSGGERSRAAVALTIAREPDVLLLDEPESDLDIVALELLESALSDAAVTLVVATHDLALAEAVCDEVWTIEEGTVTSWRGGVEGWSAGRRRREIEVRVPPPAVPREAPVPTPEDLEDERGSLLTILEDPLRWSERELDRARNRLAFVENELMAIYDGRFEPPRPRFRAVEPPLELEADRVPAGSSDGSVPGGPLAFVADWPSLPRVTVRDGVAHLVLPEPAGGAWTRWARALALRATARLVFTALYPLALQTPATGGTPPPPYEALDEDWWVTTREAWELDEGWGAGPASSGGV